MVPNIIAIGRVGPTHVNAPEVFIINTIRVLLPEENG
jgi:hypothetical protein